MTDQEDWQHTLRRFWSRAGSVCIGFVVIYTSPHKINIYQYSSQVLMSHGAAGLYLASNLTVTVCSVTWSVIVLTPSRWSSDLLSTLQPPWLSDPLPPFIKASPAPPPHPVVSVRIFSHPPSSSSSSAFILISCITRGFLCPPPPGRLHPMLLVHSSAFNSWSLLSSTLLGLSPAWFQRGEIYESLGGDVSPRHLAALGPPSSTLPGPSCAFQRLAHLHLSTATALKIKVHFHNFAILQGETQQ